MTLIAGVSGIRGIVGQTFTPVVAADYAWEFSFQANDGEIVLGRDSRASGLPVRDAVVQALQTAGRTVVDLGIVTTPGAALMVQHRRAAGGLVITASHNPGEWNGLKFLSAEGCAPSLNDAWFIQPSPRRQRARVSHDRRGELLKDSSTHTHHVSAVLKVVCADVIAGQRFRVVLDSVNGAGGESGRMLLEALGCEVIPLNAEPSGAFAHPPEPTAENLVGLCQAVSRVGADIGFAQDPDADRLAVVDEGGRYIGEEYTLVLAVMHLFAKHPGPIATNLSTSRMVDDLAGRFGPHCTVHRTAVGEANVVAAMRRHDCTLGGEGNGGVIDLRVVPVRDSLVAMALILELLVERSRPLSGIVDSIPRYVMVKEKVKCSPDHVERTLQALKSRFAEEQLNDLDGIRIDWPDGWIHVRGSNTEPLMRLIAEARDEHTARGLLRRVRQAADIE